MKQYQEIKSKHPDAILLFRVGDFYETFSDDAIKASGILGITLTKRANGSAQFVELAGFPYHALDTYLPKLVRAGQRVAICEQLEDPKLTKNIVKRGVTELVTPGVSLNDNVLEHKENNYLACVNIDKKEGGIAFLDISTGEFFTAEGSFDYIDKLLSSFKPKEVLVERSKQNIFKELFGSRLYVYPLEDWVFTKDSSIERLLKQFDTQSLKGFGVENLIVGNIAAGAILQYLDITQHTEIKHITKINRIEKDHFAWLDKFTIRNLEILSSVNEGGKSLIDIIDRTNSPMGARLMKRWLVLPLKNIKPINDRLNIVENFVNNSNQKSEIEKNIKQIGDIERLISKAALLRVNPREVVQLKNSLKAIIPIKNICNESGQSNLIKIAEQLNPCYSIIEKIENEINEEPPVQINKGNVIKEGVCEELDDLRKIMYSGKDYLKKMQERETLETGIPSLKIGFNNVFGYYFEVRNSHKNKVPEGWIRKQTLVSAERYISEELKEYESKILGAEEKVLAIETKLYNDLVLSLSDYISTIQLNASLIGQLDCYISFATVSIENNYTKPEINESKIIDIKQGRHPVIEHQLPEGENYITNDVMLNDNDQQIIIITGPNMAGKSALLRQTALIVLLAQTGCFVPAIEAKIGYVDKIFTRVGASDNISLGESTFMVEMNEASSILNNISDRSLILFDELGRGTSTYDGISIAWAIVEYIHEQPNVKAKTLFATHYHELNEMEKSFSGIKNFNVSVKELENKIIFLRKLKKGGSEHSFGIHVAKMAGMPKSIVNRSNKILESLEQSRNKKTPSKQVDQIAKNREGYQLSIFQLDDPVLKQIRDEISTIDINNLTPVGALNKLNEIQKIIGLKK
ncbi:MAG: DNA mismatch repair protein MutS [Bacteroidales bacterium]|nr:DNA mismatch repair protein MutS [Bacteroidales bacterium]MBN2758580.1 DNA mismatch repair protein MutS [Bacteroidales bacterium]